MKAAAAISTEAIATAGHSQRRAPAPAVPMGRTSLPDADSSRSSSSASFTSAMFWLRRFTSLRRQRAISRSTSGGVVEEISLAGGGSFSTTDGQRGDFRLAAERVLPSNHLVEHRAEREDIATRIERFAFDLFRRQVRNGAEDDAFFTDHLFHSQGARRFFCAHSVDGGGRGQFRQAEVQHLDRKRVV